MTRYWIMVFSVLVVAFVAVPDARADFFGVPNATLGAKNFGAGFYMDFSFRDFTISEYTEVPITGDPKFREDDLTRMDSFKLAFKASYGILDQLDVFGKVGAANIDNKDLDIEGEADLLYGGGAKVTLYNNEEARFAIGAGAQYTEFTSSVDDLTSNGRFYAEVTLKEMEAFAGFNYRGIKNFDIYGGGFYSKSEGDVFTENIDQVIRIDLALDEDIPYGGYIGADLRSDVFRAGLEARVGSEISIGMHFNYTFVLKKAVEEEETTE